VEDAVCKYIVRRAIGGEGARLRSSTVSFKAEDVCDYIVDTRYVLRAKLGL